MATSDQFDEVIDGQPWLFELAELEESIQNTDQFSAVIRGHLYLENVLISFLREALSRPELLQLDRIQFTTKVEFCAALGVLDPATIKPINKLNSIRNRLAHDLHYRVSDRDVCDLFHLFEPHHRQYLSIDGKGIDVPPLSRVIIGMIILTDFWRKSHRVARKREAEARERLKDAINRSRQVSPKGKVDYE